MIKERWFLDAITDKPDVFLLGELRLLGLCRR